MELKWPIWPSSPVAPQHQGLAPQKHRFCQPYPAPTCTGVSLQNAALKNKNVQPCLYVTFFFPPNLCTEPYQGYRLRLSEGASEGRCRRPRFTATGPSEEKGDTSEEKMATSGKGTRVATGHACEAAQEAGGGERTTPGYGEATPAAGLHCFLGDLPNRDGENTKYCTEGCCDRGLQQLRGLCIPPSRPAKPLSSQVCSSMAMDTQPPAPQCLHHQPSCQGAAAEGQARQVGACCQGKEATAPPALHMAAGDQVLALCRAPLLPTFDSRLGPGRRFASWLPHALKDVFTISKHILRIQVIT